MATDLNPALRVRLLGPVAAWRDGVPLDLGPARQRAVFAVLACHAGQVVSREALIEAVWGETPPAAAGTSLYSYVSRLRREVSPEVLISEGHGYSLRLGPGGSDVAEFDDLRQAAESCWTSRDIAGARAALDAALALWQGEALEGVKNPFAEPYRQRITELRLAVLERRAEAMIEESDGEAVAELRRLTEAYPQRETLVGLLMTALRRAGAAAEAIEVFEQFQELLADQFGMEPGPALRRSYDELTATGGARRHTRPPRDKPGILVGRDKELATVRSRLADLRRDRGGIVWIEGGPGSGKSDLLAAVLADEGLADVGYELLWAEANEAGQAQPFSLMLSCLDVDHYAPAHAREAIARRLAQPPVADQREFSAHELAGYVDQLTATRPVVLVLDGVQWSDQDSLLVWYRLTKSTRLAPLLLVATCRSQVRRAEIDRIRLAVTAGRGDVVRLDPLGAAQVGELVRSVLGAEPGPALLAAIDAAAGNPLFVREMLTALIHDEILVVANGSAELTDAAEQLVDGPFPATVRSVVTQRLATLPEPVIEALRWAAVLGAEFDMADLARVLGRPAPELITYVEDAIESGVLREAGNWFAFRHPLLRRVLYTAMPPSARVALHRQAAGMLDDGGAPVERVAEQLLAGSVGADAWVSAWMVKNLDQITGHSPWIAVELLRRVVDDVDTRDSVRETFALRLARLLFWLGRHPEAEAKIVLATTTDVTRAAEMRLLLAYIHHERGHNDRAVEMLRQVEDDPDVPEEWRIRHRAAQMLVEGAGLKDPDPSATWPAEALETDDVLEVARASGYLWLIAFRERRHADALVHMDTAIEASGHDSVYDDLRLALLECQLFTLANLDRMAEADETVERIRGLNRPGPSVGSATHDYWRGRWDSALAELNSPLQAGPIVQYDGKPHRMTMRVVHGITALIAAHRDDTVLLEAALKTPSSHEDPAGQVADFGDYLLVAKALGAEQRGDAEEALALLTPLLRTDIDDPFLLRHQWLPFAVRLALDIGDVPRAQKALEICAGEAAAEVTPARADTAARWCRSLMTGDADALVLLAKQLDRAGRKIECATAAEDAAVMLAHANRIEEAHQVCQAAMTGYIELDAGWDARRLESRLRPFGIRPRLRMTADIDRLSRRLSSAERSVVDLVMAGWSNADIASQLRMSYDTVRTHVSRIMAKLNADSRMRVTTDLLDG